MSEPNKPRVLTPQEVKTMPRAEYEAHKATVLAHTAAEARNKLSTTTLKGK